MRSIRRKQVGLPNTVGWGGRVETTAQCNGNSDAHVLTGHTVYLRTVRQAGMVVVPLICQ